MSETVLAEYAALKNRVDDLRKKERLPYWRLVYADFSLSRIAEYLTLEKSGEAQELLRRLNRWVEEHERELDRTAKPEPAKISIWNADFVQKLLDALQAKITAKNHLIPVAERISFSKSMELAKKRFAEGNLDGTYSELFSLRNLLIARLRRSYRARAAMLLYSRQSTAFGRLPTGAVVGLYNSERTLENALSLVGERDAIWVEDFLELYNSLSKITERLAPAARKRR